VGSTNGNGKWFYPENKPLTGDLLGTTITIMFAANSWWPTLGPVWIVVFHCRLHK